MIFAILLSEIKNLRYKKVVQTFTTIPNFISWVIVFSLGFMIFSSDGLLASIYMAFGKTPPSSILGDVRAVYWFQTALSQWKVLGWNAIIYLAAIAGIDQELYEAAAIDGANRFHNILHITIPSLLPTYLVLLLLAIGNFVNVGFEQFFVFNNKVVAESIEVLDVYVYRVGLFGQDYSYGVAIGIMKTVVSVALLFIANAIAKKIRGTTLI
jgi:putative aldouronate transport system permease protein